MNNSVLMEKINSVVRGGRMSEFYEVTSAEAAKKGQEKRDQLRHFWWGRIALPWDEKSWEDLCTPIYTTGDGKICVESKEEIMKRLKHIRRKAKNEMET